MAWKYVALAAFLAFMAAGFLFLARIVGLGFTSNFLSRTVLNGVDLIDVKQMKKIYHERRSEFQVPPSRDR